MIEVIAHTPADVLPQLTHPIEPGEECSLLRFGQGQHIFQRLLEHTHQCVIKALVIHAASGQKIEHFLTVKHRQLGQALGLALRLLVVGVPSFSVQ